MYVNIQYIVWTLNFSNNHNNIVNLSTLNTDTIILSCYIMYYARFIGDSNCNQYYLCFIFRIGIKWVKRNGIICCVENNSANWIIIFEESGKNNLGLKPCLSDFGKIKIRSPPSPLRQNLHHYSSIRRSCNQHANQNSQNINNCEPFQRG